MTTKLVASTIYLDMIPPFEVDFVPSDTICPDESYIRFRNAHFDPGLFRIYFCAQKEWSSETKKEFETKVQQLAETINELGKFTEEVK